MITETLTWFEVTERLPDADSTVMYEAPAMAEPIGLGWLDDDQWRDLNAVPIEGVVRWAILPRGGLA